MKGYDQDCPVARTLDVVGGKWALLILRDLFLHRARRFQDFQDSLKGIAPNTLSARLKSLEDQDVITSRLYCKHPPRAEYLLTEKGSALGPVVQAMRAWGQAHTESDSVVATRGR